MMPGLEISLLAISGKLITERGTLSLETRPMGWLLCFPLSATATGTPRKPFQCGRYC